MSLPVSQGSPSEARSPAFLIAQMKITELFGRYSYVIGPEHIPKTPRSGPPLMLLYGDNGCGKTTILRLLWQILSPRLTSDDISSIIETPFQQFEITLNNGHQITARKLVDHVGPFEILVLDRRGKQIVQQGYQDPRVGPQTLHRYGSAVLEREEEDEFLFFLEDGHDDYREYVNGLAVKPVLLADDRRFYTQDEQFVRRPRRSGGTRHGGLRPDEKRPFGKPSTASILDAVMVSVTEWLRQQVFSATTAGARSVDSIYLEVLTQIAKAEPHEGAPNIDQVQQRLRDLDTRTSAFSEFGLVPHLRSREFLKQIQKLTDDAQGLVGSVLGPYLDSYDARLDSLQETERVVRTFVGHVNKYLVDKSVTFKPLEGMVISSGDIRLGPEQLSSGERQVLLLLCNCLLARTGSKLFLIDEPEISLNPKWLRTLVQALLDCVALTDVQFVMATHSIEIVSKQRQYVAQLIAE